MYLIKDINYREELRGKAMMGRYILTILIFLSEIVIV